MEPRCFVNKQLIIRLHQTFKLYQKMVINLVNWHALMNRIGSYSFWGYGIFSAIYLGNIVKGVQTGPNYVDFKDG